MPTHKQIQDFVADVLSNDHVGAIERWYDAAASMQENQSEPRRGRDRLIAEESAMLGSLASVRTELIGSPIVNGDFAAIRWRFTFQRPDGTRMTMEEVAWQEWRDDRIIREQFFYDPGQRRFRTP